MKIKKKIIRLGFDSRGILLNKIYCESYGLNLGDEVYLDVKKIEEKLKKNIK